MSKISQIETNKMSEMTAAKVFIGGSMETVYKHATSLLLLLPIAEVQPTYGYGTAPDNTGARPRSTRDAALRCRAKLSQFVDNKYA